MEFNNFEYCSSLMLVEERSLFDIINDQSLTDIPPLISVKEDNTSLAPLPDYFEPLDTLPPFPASLEEFDEFYAEPFNFSPWIPIDYCYDTPQPRLDSIDNNGDLQDVIIANTVVIPTNNAAPMINQLCEDGGSCGRGESKKAIGRTKSSEIGLEEIKRYFYMPITKAAKEMNVGLTLLKKRCRELGIPRWPHRKMKSLKTLINNIQELGNCGDIVSQELAIYQRLMEENPEIELTESTKKLRQACFKANYKKRREIQASFEHQTNCKRMALQQLTFDHPPF